MDLQEGLLTFGTKWLMAGCSEVHTTCSERCFHIPPCQRGSHGCGGGKADCDFQPRRRPKRDALHQGDVRRLSEQMDSASVGKLCVSAGQCWRSRTMAQVSDAGESELREDPEPNERPLQSWNPVRDL